jgi:hypothetical protein
VNDENNRGVILSLSLESCLSLENEQVSAFWSDSRALRGRFNACLMHLPGIPILRLIFDSVLDRVRVGGLSRSGVSTCPGGAVFCGNLVPVS